jgi:hypothetical protein
MNFPNLRLFMRASMAGRAGQSSFTLPCHAPERQRAGIVVRRGSSASGRNRRSQGDVMSDMGGYIWFIALGLGLLALAGAIAYGTARGRRRSAGDPNHAWKQAASESGHPEVARPEK